MVDADKEIFQADVMERLRRIDKLFDTQTEIIRSRDRTLLDIWHHEVSLELASFITHLDEAEKSADDDKKQGECR